MILFSPSFPVRQLKTKRQSSHKEYQMKKLVLLVAMIVSQNAMADGFVCQTEEGDLNVKIYNHVNPQDGTRNGSTMVLSDPSVGMGRKTIAKFTDIKDTLSGSGTLYEAKVDLRVVESRARGELIAGTKLGQLAKIVVGLRYNYLMPVEHGELVTGWMFLQKRNGEEIHRQLECSRYLKN
jgi:hypothetical protein